MPSPTCTVNSASTTNGVNVAASSVPTIALVDATGVTSWSITCLNTDETITAATVNQTLVINQVAKTATFTATGIGTAMQWQSQVNGGLDSNGKPSAALTTTFGVFVLTGGSKRVIATGETTESSQASGWIADVNATIRNVSTGPIGSSTTTTSYFGGVAYTTITVANTNRTIDTTTADSVVFVDTTNATVQLTLPANTNGRRIRIVDIGGNLFTNNLTLVPTGGSKINRIAGNKVLSTNGGKWDLEGNGTDWFI